MAISAQQVKQLREMTGAGMMDCKKALEETGGDMDGAVEILQKKGAAAAAKKAGRIAAEGMISTWLSADRTSGVMTEVNCETDFVARNDQFQAFVNTISRTIGESSVTTLEELEGLSAAGIGKSVTEFTGETINTIGEKISTRRFTRFTAENGLVADYIHAGGQIGVLVHVEGGGGDKVDEFARDVAMHIAAMNPPYLTSDDIPADAQAYQERFFSERAKESGKPDAIIPKIVAGQLDKWRAESSLLNQPFVKDSDVTVGELQARLEGPRIVAFARFEVGEGIEKRQEKSLSEEVAEQLRGSK
ncbi:MAG: elongation factor Ts [Bradymonadaceae bacterium]|nr:elongation factor Ts [Lujinxingiaceae bacterium]